MTFSRSDIPSHFSFILPYFLHRPPPVRMYTLDAHFLRQFHTKTQKLTHKNTDKQLKSLCECQCNRCFMLSGLKVCHTNLIHTLSDSKDQPFRLFFHWPTSLQHTGHFNRNTMQLCNGGGGIISVTERWFQYFRKWWCLWIFLRSREYVETDKHTNGQFFFVSLATDSRKCYLSDYSVVTTDPNTFKLPLLGPWVKPITTELYKLNNHFPHSHV